jgi:hypothetical protein
VSAAATKPRKRCETCANLRAFELSDDLFTCPVVNIRIHRETAETFGCSMWESKYIAAQNEAKRLVREVRQLKRQPKGHGFKRRHKDRYRKVWGT